MIKTTSFALPRPHSLAPSSAKTAARHKAIKMARAREAAQTAPVNPFASAMPVPEISAAQARELLQASAPQTKKRAASSPVPSPASASLSAPKRVASPTPISRPVAVATPVPATIAPAPVSAMITAPKTAKAAPKSKASNVKESPALSAEPVLTASPVLPLVEVVPSVPVAVVAPVKVPSAPKKAKKARVPANLAEQYGQNISKRVENGIEDVPSEDETPRKRLSRTERQARREMMNPDDDLLARLQRVHNAVPTAKPEKRPRGWRFECGRCGQTSFFQTSGALCRCGALAIKE